MNFGFQSPNVSGAGLGLKIIGLLRQYQTMAPLPVDFVARALEVSVEPLTTTLQELRARGVVKIQGEGHGATVALV